jgi:TM2 domain-containing membrane protein YozV
MPNVSVEVQARDSNEEKSPVLAFVMSCLVPGAGQYYNGDIAKGVIQEVLVVGGITLALAAATSSSSGFYFENYSEDDEATTLIWAGLGVAGASYLWSIIDAPISAIRINKARGQYYGHLLEFNSDKQVVGFDLATNGKTIGAKFSMHF